MAVVLTVRARWSDVAEAGGLPGIPPMAVAVGLNVLGNALLTYTWREIVAVVGPRLPYRSAMWVWSSSQLARFALSTAQAGARAVMAARYGVTTNVAAATAVVELAWFSAMDGVLLFLTLPWWLTVAAGWRWVAVLAVLPAVVVVAGIVRPDLLLRLAAWGLRLPVIRRLRGGTLADAVDRVEVTSVTSARITGYFLVNFVLRAGAFCVVVAATIGHISDILLFVVGASVFGQFVGRIAVFSPGGIGPREGATAFVLAPVIGAGPALIAVAAVRLAEVAAELLFLGLARAARHPPQPGTT